MQKNYELISPTVIVAHMNTEKMRQDLCRIYEEKLNRNNSFSLRAFSRQLGVSDSTLSQYLSGKRKFTEKAIKKLAPKLGLNPITYYSNNKILYKSLTENEFSLISEWYYDAIIEYTNIKKSLPTPTEIAGNFGITKRLASIAMERLTRLKMIEIKGKTWKALNQDFVDYEDLEVTTGARKNYQKQMLEKSLDALSEIEKPKRKHSSITFSLNRKKLEIIKNLMDEFQDKILTVAKTDLDSEQHDEVYSLQLSLFPLLKKIDLNNSGENHEN